MPSSQAEIFLINTSASQAKPSIIRQTDKEIEFRTIWQHGNVLNRNNKIYPSDIIWNAAQQTPIQEQLKRRCWYGEANHPMSPSIERQLYTDMKNVSHIILTFEREGDIFKGNALTFGSAMGPSMYAAIDQGGIISFSLRGLHKLVRDPNDQRRMLVKDLRIFCYDWVTFPSHEDAHMIPANESAKIFEKRLPKELINTVMASENAGVLEQYEDFLDEEIKDSSVEDSSLILKSSHNTLNIKLKNKITTDILNEFF